MIIFTSTYIQFIRICSVWAAQDAFMYKRTSTVLKSKKILDVRVYLDSVCAVCMWVHAYACATSKLEVTRIPRHATLTIPNDDPREGGKDHSCG